MNIIKKNWHLITLAIFIIVVLLPPVIMPEKLLFMNNDTVNHIKVFEEMKNGNWLAYIYPWQLITGIVIIGINNITNIEISTIFMWFNYIVLIIAGITISWLTWLITKNKFATAVSPFISIFGIGSTMHLFYSGTIFNILNLMIIFPLAIILFILAIEKKSVNLFIIMITFVGILTFFHPSGASGITTIFKDIVYPEGKINILYAILTFFGICSSLLFGFCIYKIIKSKPKFNIMTIMPIGILSVYCLMYIILMIFGIGSFSSRYAINAFLILGILLCILLGISMNNKEVDTLKVKIGLCIIIGIGVIPNLINWFTWVSFYNPTRGIF